MCTARAAGLIQSRVVNRTATFVFYIGDRFFGAITAYVQGPEAANYSFTSGLPVQVLRNLAPTLAPLVTGAQAVLTPDKGGNGPVDMALPPVKEEEASEPE